MPGRENSKVIWSVCLGKAEKFLRATAPDAEGAGGWGSKETRQRTGQARESRTLRVSAKETRIVPLGSGELPAVHKPGRGQVCVLGRKPPWRVDCRGKTLK